MAIGDKEIEQQDMNPNSPTYLQKRWLNIGQSDACQPATVYQSAAISEQVKRNNCGEGFTGTSVYYSLAAGSYTSTISQADANSKARAYFDANKQTFANSQGECIQNKVLVQNVTAGFVFGTHEEACDTYTGYKLYTATGGLDYYAPVYWDKLGNEKLSTGFYFLSSGLTMEVNAGNVTGVNRLCN